MVATHLLAFLAGADYKGFLDFLDWAIVFQVHILMAMPCHIKMLRNPSLDPILWQIYL
jgi:hypothetical protein